MKVSARVLVSTACIMPALVSCEKKEKPYPIPPITDTAVATARVTMGGEYTNQVFFSFENGVVDSSRNDSWHLAFSNAEGQKELWINGGNLVFIKPTGKSSLAEVTDTASYSSIAWVNDDPSGLNGESGLGNLETNNHLDEVLLVLSQKLVDGKRQSSLYKIIIAADDNSYTLYRDTLTGSAPQTIALARDADYNYTYYSFNDGVVKPEPPKATWDIVFTRYQYLYRDYPEPGTDFPYIVNGALTNPYQTQSADDSLASYEFADFGLEQANAFELQPNRDIIGFDWKSVDITTGQYTVLPDKMFLVETQKGALYKLHFTGFYENGVKGSPLFEYKRLR